MHIILKPFFMQKKKIVKMNALYSYAFSCVV